MGASSGLKAELASIGVVNACGCTLRRNGVTNYSMASTSGASAFVTVAYETDDSSLCEQWEQFLVENSPVEAKTPKHVLELFDGAEWRASQWLEDGALARALGQVQRAQLCFERCQFWLERAQHFTEELTPKAI